MPAERAPPTARTCRGPADVVTGRDEFAGLEGVVQVVIFGSWAARYEGERGLPPNDVDVLVVGAPD